MHALIVGNGAAPGKTLFEIELSKSNMLIAADGGAQTCFLYGVTPDVVIGDLDSYLAKPNTDVNLIHDADQETNDLEKALNYALKQMAQTVTVLGATGERLDQTLKNISVMVQFTPKFKTLILKDDNFWMKILPGNYTFEIEPGTTVSLFPVSGTVHGITTTGLKFPLNGEALQNGIRDGSSNIATQNHVTISHTAGDLLLMVFETK